MLQTGFRRIAVSGAVTGDFDYFKKLANHIKEGGDRAFLHHLLNLDLSAFIDSEDDSWLLPEPKPAWPAAHECPA